MLTVFIAALNSVYSLMMIRTRRNVAITLLLASLSWMAIFIYLGNGKSRKMASVSTELPSNLSFSIPTQLYNPEQKYPDGLNSHSERKLPPTLSKDELDELADQSADVSGPENAENTSEIKISESATDDLVQNVEELHKNEESPANDNNRKIINCVVDKVALKTQSAVDLEYLLKTFVRAWYARGYTPNLIDIRKLQSHAKYNEIMEIVDQKVKWVASRVALLSILGGGLVAEVTALTEPSPSKNQESFEDQENNIISILLSSGIIYPEASSDTLERLLDRILTNDEEILSKIQTNDSNNFIVISGDAASKIRAAVRKASETRNIACFGASESFIKELNSAYTRVVDSNGGDREVDAVFVSSDNIEELNKLIEDNDPMKTELSAYLKRKIIVPKDSIASAAKIIEFSFGIYFDLSLEDEKEDSEKQFQGEQIDIVKWALSSIESKLKDMESVDSQIPPFLAQK